MMQPAERKILRLTAGSHFLVHLFEGAIPPLIPILVVVFDTNYFTMGIIVTIFSYLFGFGALPSGFLAGKIGPRRLITVYLLGAGVTSVAVFGVRSLPVYGVLMGLAGLAASTYHPAANTLISYAIRLKGNAFGIHGITGSLGTALVPVLTAAIATRMGWQAPHVVFGVLGIALAVYSLRVPEFQRAAPEAQPAADSGAHDKRRSIVAFVILIVSTGALGLSYRGVVTFLPSYMGEQVRFAFLGDDAVTVGGFVATVALLSGAVGQYLAGRLVDRYPAEHLYLIAIAVAGVFVLLMSQTTGIVLVGAAVVFALFNFATQPIQNYLLSHYVPSRLQGAGFGIHFFVVFGVGSAAAAVSGYIADELGLAAVFYAMALCFVVAAVMAAYLVVSARRSALPLS